MTSDMKDLNHMTSNMLGEGKLGEGLSCMTLSSMKGQGVQTS